MAGEIEREMQVDGDKTMWFEDDSRTGRDCNSDEPPPTEVLDAMRSYAEVHQVQEMLHILLTRLLETQPLDPFELLIQTLQKDDQLDALEKKATLRRFDLRREKTKKQLVLHFYKRLVALQRTQHKDKLEAQGTRAEIRRKVAQLLSKEALEDVARLIYIHHNEPEFAVAYVILSGFVVLGYHLLIGEDARMKFVTDNRDTKMLRVHDKLAGQRVMMTNTMMKSTTRTTLAGGA
ncbi:Hypothetical protein PHPALM_8525 [Phytophthora palmivora]|uniref:Uncharacterized protein n=1 Tax=Phytophthora palmivora TaxID=4796 RepID=A0A2P4YA23_9STRA|nr:Hypothetical protein PHPALM_8525 [Phytophthora palmivora]